MSTDYDDDDRPRRARRSWDDDEERPARRRRDRLEDDYDDEPPRRRRGGTPHRGGMILTFGILGLCCCGIFAILAATMGSTDLKEMESGRMDRSGESMTRVGQILGFVGIGLWVLGVALRMVLTIARHA
jgi:hypothetical protein